MHDAHLEGRFDFSHYLGEDSLTILFSILSDHLFGGYSGICSTDVDTSKANEYQN